MPYDNLGSLKLLQWNARGISTFSVCKQLDVLISDNNIDIVFLCETFLKPHHKFRLNGYKIYRNDRDTHGGGVAIAIKHGLVHNLLPICPTNSVENISICMNLNNKNIIFTSAYCSKYSIHFSSDIHTLTSCCNDEYFIFGDLNARHTSWNNLNNNTAGDRLYQLQNNSNFFIYHPLSPTYFSFSGLGSTLDILLSNSNSEISDLIPLIELDSDHYPVLCSIKFKSILRFDNHIFNFKAANWDNFRSYIDDKINLIHDFKIESASPDSIDRTIDFITKIIIDAKTFAVPKISKGFNSFQISSICKSLIVKRNHFKRRSQRCSSDLRNLFKSLMNRCNSLININLSTERNIFWNTTLSKLETGCKNFWFINKCIRGKFSKNIPKLTDVNSVFTTDNEKANAISEYFSKSFQITINNKSTLELVLGIILRI